MSENQLAQLNDAEEYDVCIDSSLASGHLSYGEYLLKGKESGGSAYFLSYLSSVAGE